MTRLETIYIVPNVLSQRDLISRPDNMDETVQHTSQYPNSDIPYMKVQTVATRKTNGRFCHSQVYLCDNPIT